MKSDRATTIRQLLFARGQLTIAEIAAAVSASEPTVRRDLAGLEAEGAVMRTHGGARIAEGAGTEVGFETREMIALPQKRAISEAAHALLRPHQSVFLDAGTTVLQLARLIRLRPLPLDVFTNCLPAAQVLLPVEGVRVTLIGGTMRPENASMVGPIAEEALAGLWFDKVILGMGALGPDMVISTADPLEASLNRVMLSRTDAPLVLADSSKFGARLTHRIALMSSAMRVLADAGLSAEWQARVRKTGARLTLAEMPA